MADQVIHHDVHHEPSHSNSNATLAVVLVLILLFVLALFWFGGFRALSGIGRGGGGTTIEVPRQVDVNVNR